MFEAYSEQFFGFGRWDAPIWFVGLEEAGGTVPNALERRLETWRQRGCRELEDAPGFYPTSGQTLWHRPQATLQPTWRQLMRILFLARGKSMGDAALLEHQRLAFGALAGDVCLVELSPLPAKDHTHWPYAHDQNLPAWAHRRDSFMERMLPARLATLQKNLAAHAPRAVLFYFWKPREHAKALAGGDFSPLIPEKLLYLSLGKTTFFVIAHPARYPDSYATGLGEFLHKRYSHLFTVGCAPQLDSSRDLAQQINATQQPSSPPSI